MYFIISVISVGNALIETKQTMSRLREVARFVADIRVLRSGYWITVPSTELVPGDILKFLTLRFLFSRVIRFFFLVIALSTKVCLLVNLSQFLNILSTTNLLTNL